MRTDQEPALRAENLHHYLGKNENKVHVLRGINLELHPREVTAVVGPSGCGKSTLLYLLGLLDRPESGEIFIQGKSFSKSADGHRTAARNEHLGFVFQFHFLLPEFSALENILLPMKKLNKVSTKEMEERGHSLLKNVGLEQKAHRKASDLSGGEQQRVAIARALANSPSLILADEPTGNLDNKNSLSAFDLLYQFAHANDHAVLIVTHNTSLAEKCDRTLTMSDGQFLGI